MTVLPYPGTRDALAREADEASEQAVLLLASIVRRMNLRATLDRLMRERELLRRLAQTRADVVTPEAIVRVGAIDDLVSAAMVFQEAVVRYEQAMGEAV